MSVESVPSPIPARRPLVKICGVTRVEDAVAAVELGADLIGLNFWPKSPRRVQRDAARAIAETCRARVAIVGVFVDASAAEIRRHHDELGFDLVQLHGDEPPGIADDLNLPIIEAFRFFPSMEALSAWQRASAILLDVAAGSRYGGSARGWNYASARRLPRDSRPLLIAGGIRPETARAALAASGADGVDVASGVERSPGEKDRERMQRLMEEVRRGAT